MDLRRFWPQKRLFHFLTALPYKSLTRVVPWRALESPGGGAGFKVEIAEEDAEGSILRFNKTCPRFQLPAQGQRTLR